MPDSSDIADATRRTILRATAGALGVAATGGASAHEWISTSSTTEVSGAEPEDGDVAGGYENAPPVGYHSLGGIGGEATAGRPSTPHYGGRTELRTHGDYAYVSFFSSDSPTPGRGMAIVDISGYNNADTTEEVDAAQMSVVSFLPNDSTGTAAMDLKVSDDGQYVFLGTQPYTALFPDPTTDPTGAAAKSEAGDPSPNEDDKVGAEAPGAVVAVDVSDKGNPQTVGAFEVSGTGIHNLFHHRIGESEYVFAIHDLNDGTEGVYVLAFDRSSGQLEPVNRWTADGDTAQGEVGGEMKYIHDIEVQNDPDDGRPVAYLAYWDNGLYALDVSDPADIEALGHFTMDACHFTTPAPERIDGKRLVVASQETPGSDSRTGTVHLLDADGLLDEGVTEFTELDVWEWINEDSSLGQTTADVEFGNFELSPHNSSLEKHVHPRSGRPEYWLHQSHYHGGVRYLKVDTRGNSITFDPSGFSRPTYAVPDESKMQGLAEVTPNVWTAVASNGVTFASDINQGIHAIKHEDIPLGGAPPTFVSVDRSDDGSVFTGGQTNHVELSVAFGPGHQGETVRVRDRLPAGWSTASEGGIETEEGGGSTFVEFDAAATSGDALDYFVEAPEGIDQSGSYTFGPVEVSADDGDTWFAVPGTLSTESVFGQSTGIPSGLGMVGTVGVLAHQRERIANGVRSLLDR